MAMKEMPLSELLMQDPEPIVNMTSPLNSVDNSSRDMVTVQEELEKRLKQRAGRQDLVERNILPPLSFPTAPKLFTNSTQLQRAQIADNLQKRMRNRPARDNLMQMNILPDLQLNIDPALQATQLQLKKNKLADTLNDKIANRPGPLQLLQNGIIEPQLSEVVKGYELDQTGTKESPESEKGGFSAIPEISLYSGEGAGGQRPPLQQRHSIAGVSPTPADVLGMEVSQGGVDSSSYAVEARKFSDSSISPAPSPIGNYEEAKSPEKSPRDFTSSYPPILRTSLSSGMLTGNTKSISPSIPRKKQQKKYRKLRYHEYVPPSKSTPKGGKTNPKPPSKSDSPYSSLLQQQQLFLQLQVLQNQYPNGVLMQKLPDMINSLSKEQKSLAIAAAKGVSVTSPTDLPLNKQATIPPVLPVEMPNKHSTSSVRFEDLKVSDLKSACKELGMIVSGKKAELVERLMDQNKGVLPALALPENLPKESRRQFSQGQNSIDSQFSSSSVVSPGSPNSSPVFKFPSERGAQDTSSSTGAKQPGLVQLPEVLPAANLHKEINEIIERQKRNYICQKGISEKSIAPRPELTELLAIKLPSYPAGSKGVNNSRQADTRTQGVMEKSSRSLPASPKTSPANTPGSTGRCGYEILECGGNTDKETVRIPSMKNFKVGGDAGKSSEHSLGSFPGSSPDMLNHSTANPLSGANHSVSAGVSTLTTSSYYHQQQPISSLAGIRPGRASLPTQALSNGVPPSALPQQGGNTVGLPSYNSVMRSRSIGGPQGNPNLPGMENMHNGVSFMADMTGSATPPNEMPGKAMTPDLFVSDSGEMMDTGESSISDIFDILRADEEYSHTAQPASLPGFVGNQVHQSRRPPSSLPQTPQYGGHTSKANHVQNPAHHSHYMLGNIMPFGNPTLTAQNKSGSDMCLNLMDGKEGQKNSTSNSGMYPPGNNNLATGNELNWLDLDNTSSLGLSPTLQSGAFSSINSHSNPGSLPHDQFQNSFLEDGGMVGHGMLGPLDKNSGSAMNGYGMGGVGGLQSFLDSGVLHQSGLYPSEVCSEEEARLLELGLSTS